MSARRHAWQWLLIGSGCVLAAAGWLALADAPGPTTATQPRGEVAALRAPAPPVSEPASHQAAPAVSRETVMQMASTPLHFEHNAGQAPPGVSFMARGVGYAVLLSDTETTIVLSAVNTRATPVGQARPALVRTRLVDASAPAAVTGEMALPGTVNYYRGSDPSRWQRGVTTFERVRASRVYPGIDAVYYGNQRQLQYDFEVAPGADPARIALAFDGIDGLEVEPGGDLVIRVGDRELRQKKPYTYQDGAEGRQEVASRFVVTGDRRVGFDVGDFDPSRTLVIDPILTYSSYFGGDSEEVAYDVALGPDGSVYITGITADVAALPTVGAFQSTSGSQPDAFVTKFVPNGTSLSIAFSSYLGGNADENTAGYGYAGDIAVDDAGTAYLTGSTRSSDFPFTPDAHDKLFGGNNVTDAFFAKVSSSGQLVYATYLGGIATDVGSGIALGPGNVAYIFGYTSSDEVTEGAPVTANAYDNQMDGGSDAFIARFTPGGTLDYFSFLGGNAGEAVFYTGAIAVDAAGLVYLATETGSSVGFLPANGFDTTLGILSTGAFFVKLDPSLGAGSQQLLYSTYLTGTNGQVWAYGLAVTDSGLAYIVGETSTSTGFPIKNALQATYVGGNRDAYLLKVDTNQTGADSLLFGTYLGGDQADTAYDVAIDDLGRAVVAGYTFSTSPQVAVKFPLVRQVASCPTFMRLTPFVTVFNTTGSAIDLSSCYAASYAFYGVATRANGEIWLVGATDDDRTNPTSPEGVPMVNAEQGAYGRDFPGTGGDRDALVVRISPATDLSITKQAPPDPVLPGGTVRFTLTVTNTGSEPASSVVVTDTLPSTLTFVSCGAITSPPGPGVADGICGGSGNARTITHPTLPPGHSSHISILASVNDGVGGGATIANTAVVTSETADANLANNTATAQVSTPTLTPGGDVDGDGLLNEFETRYGLNPFSSGTGNGPNDDPDADGRNNLEEQQDGTHPRGFVITYLAEGATGQRFRTRLAVANPTSAPALVLTRFQRGDGTTIPDYRTVPPMSRATIDVESLAGLESAEFSTLVEADVQVVVDRTMTWDQNGYGSHAERGILTRAATKWYFAEGATFGPFSLFYLIQNPSTQTAQVKVTYLLPTGSPLVKDYVVGPQSRFNIWVDNEGLTDPSLAPLASAEPSAIVESTNGVPIIAERAMYLDQPGRPFGAGHESAGVTAPSTQWFLAEGATGDYFDLFILIANPQVTPATVQADFLLTTGQVITRTYAVAGNSRFNIWVDNEDPQLVDAAMSTRITSTNGVPIIVERSMWWPGPTSATWQEAHNSPGEVTTGTRWAMAEGEVGGPRNTDTYVLIANTSVYDGTARVTVLFEDGSAPVTRSFPLAANSRSNVAPAADFPETAGKRFGMLIESIGATPAQIVVERAMYSDAGGVHWAAGTNALATKLP